MSDRRLISWLETTPVLPQAGRIGVFNAWPGLSLPEIDPDRIRAVQPMAGPHAALVDQGIKTAKIVNYSYDAVILRAPRDLRTRDRARKLIVKIEEALVRVEDGSYGYCEDTDEPIGLRRLEARPIATLSLEAQERHERMERSHRND